MITTIAMYLRMDVRILHPTKVTPPQNIVMMKSGTTRYMTAVLSRTTARGAPEYSMCVPPAISVSASAMSNGRNPSFAWAQNIATMKASTPETLPSMTPLYCWYMRTFSKEKLPTFTIVVRNAIASGSSYAKRSFISRAEPRAPSGFPEALPPMMSVIAGIVMM